MPGILAVDICLRDTAKIVTGFLFIQMSTSDTVDYFYQLISW